MLEGPEWGELSLQQGPTRGSTNKTLLLRQLLLQLHRVLERGTKRASGFPKTRNLMMTAELTMISGAKRISVRAERYSF